ncbi:MAG: phosphoglycerate kinase [Candidatus Marinimicrobia bacterium]|nr:phosphoglycerate kinase [Candidatus Neomarinimicrobiota bacterium]|tara:strand:- start:1658 stop:2827 length:1170 start_codon:yes stop_codon:yes gene_type:complete
MKSIKDINIKNKKVLIRVDYNVPIINGTIKDSSRINASLETIKYCIDNSCKIILMSHLGRPVNQDSKYSLKIIFEYLRKIFPGKVFFSKNCISKDSINKSENLNAGEIHLLENLRFYKQEIDNESLFCEKLSKHADIYINDAFGTAHRMHASNVGITKYFEDKGFGFLIAKEIKYLDYLIKNSKKNICLILGGAKISDKIKLINRFIDIADSILIGGAMSNNFLYAKGFNIGKSLFEENYVSYASDILRKKSKTKIYCPLDLICTEDVNLKLNIRTSKAEDINDNEFAVDIGPLTRLLYADVISKSQCVIWNGPMGIAEISDYSDGTIAIIDAMKENTINESVSIIGGGDTGALIDKKEYHSFTHISTGGGACLKLLSGDVMPSFKALC